ncbi:MAG TPA: GNAT family N-acetyltransferase [Solirubrobacteraceae bacterium]|nr:GNAT family N-acetyltransferase [Solirubrobacteraceae bacterium]
MSHSPEVRRATSADVPALARMLARAFFDDPVASWAWPPQSVRERAFERYQLVRLRQLLVDEEVWTTADLSCAALWAPPARWRKTPREELEPVRAFAHPRLLARAPLVALGWFRMELRHPARPHHWYLAVLGTDPACQGRGLGSAVLAPVLERCDADGVGAYLESSKERNIDFYARHGFRVLEHMRLLRGPSVWGMWRDPRP